MVNRVLPPWDILIMRKVGIVHWDQSVREKTGYEAKHFYAEEATQSE